MENINKRRSSVNLKARNIISSTIFALSLILNFSITSYAEQQKLVAITAIVAHQSLEAAQLGVLDELKAAGYEQGKNLKIIEQNAQGSISNATLIAKNFVALKPDAIVAISTPSAQSALNAAKGTNIPLVISSVTDPVAAGLVKNIDIAEPNITGAMDFPLIKEEIAFIQTVVPHLKTLGLLYNAGEANSAKTIELMKEVCHDRKIEFVTAVATNSSQVAAALTSLVGNVDAVYVPSDNTVFASMAKIVQIARQNKLPLVSSDPDSVKQGMLGCVGYTQYAVGQAAGKLLVQVLQGYRLLKIARPSKAEVFMNETSANALGIKIPESVLGMKVNIVE